MELYEYARPDLMSGKKILYLHGFASSGQNGTVKAMGTLLPNAQIIAPDLPVDPHETMQMLRELCAKEKPDLIVGASMGAMYAEQLRGFWRILVNPAFMLADTLLKNNGLGRQEFHNPRRDGQTSFLVNKGLLEAFREVSSHKFEGLPDNVDDPDLFGDCNTEQELVYGMFGVMMSWLQGHSNSSRNTIRMPYISRGPTTWTTAFSLNPCFLSLKESTTFRKNAASR